MNAVLGITRQGDLANMNAHVQCPADWLNPRNSRGGLYEPRRTRYDDAINDTHRRTGCLCVMLIGWVWSKMTGKVATRSVGKKARHAPKFGGLFVDDDCKVLLMIRHRRHPTATDPAPMPGPALPGGLYVIASSGTTNAAGLRYVRIARIEPSCSIIWEVSNTRSSSSAS